MWRIRNGWLGRVWTQRTEVATTLSKNSALKRCREERGGKTGRWRKRDWVMKEKSQLGRTVHVSKGSMIPKDIFFFYIPHFTSAMYTPKLSCRLKLKLDDNWRLKYNLYYHPTRPCKTTNQTTNCWNWLTILCIFFYWGRLCKTDTKQTISGIHLASSSTAPPPSSPQSPCTPPNTMITPGSNRCCCCHHNHHHHHHSLPLPKYAVVFLLNRTVLQPIPASDNNLYQYNSSIAKTRGVNIIITTH